MLANLLAQETGDAAGGGGTAIIAIVYIGLLVLFLVGYWKLFVKLGRPGWMGIVPFVNVWQIYNMKGDRNPWVWLILSFIPCVNIAALIALAIDTGNLFGKGTGWKVALALFPGLATIVLAFGDSQADPSQMRGPVSA